MKRRDYALLGALLLLRLGLDLTRLASASGRFDNGEERYTATVGWYLQSAGLWDQALALQYKTFCGGCTVHALSAAARLAAFGDHIWVWKSGALVWTAAAFFVGIYALFKREGRGAALAFGVLYAAPPLGLTDLSLMLWGNHHEGGLFVLAALVGGPLQGLAIGLGWAFVRTTVYSWVLLIPAIYQRKWRGVLMALVAASLSLVPAARGDAGSYDLTTVFPYGLGGAIGRASALLDPNQLGPRLYPGIHLLWPTTLWIAAFIGSVGVLLLRRRWVVPVLVGAFVVLWCSSGPAIPRMGPDGALLQARYHAPWLLLGILAIAAAAPYTRGALLALAMVPTLFVWLPTLRTLTGDRWDNSPGLSVPALSSPVVDHVGFSGVAFRRLSFARLERAHSEDPATELTLRRLEGYAAAEAVRIGATDAATARAALTGEAISAFWQARTGVVSDFRALNEALSDDPDPVAAGRGVAWNLRFQRPTLEELRRGLYAGQPCVLCAATGNYSDSCGADCADPLRHAKEPFMLDKGPAAR